jgi:hypothetical protein
VCPFVRSVSTRAVHSVGMRPAVLFITMVCVWLLQNMDGTITVAEIGPAMRVLGFEPTEVRGSPRHGAALPPRAAVLIL